MEDPHFSDLARRTTRFSYAQGRTEPVRRAMSIMDRTYRDSEHPHQSIQQALIGFNDPLGISAPVTGISRLTGHLPSTTPPRCKTRKYSKPKSRVIIDKEILKNQIEALEDNPSKHKVQQNARRPNNKQYLSRLRAPTQASGRQRLSTSFVH